MAELILAIDKNYGIGYKGRLPWKCKEDMTLFKEKTMGKILVVGRKTYESLCGNQLPGRELRVLSRDESIPKEIRMYHIEDVYKIPNWENSIVFAGGVEVYKAAIQRGMVRRVYLSMIHGDYQCDVFIPRTLLSLNFTNVSTIEYNTFTHHTLEILKYSENQYLDLVNRVLTQGDERIGRNGGVISIFNANMQFDLRNNSIPLLTTKKMFVRGILDELLFFLRGDTDSKILENNNVNIWKGNSSRDFLDSLDMKNRPVGIIGPMYGYQWRHFDAEYDDQLACPKEPGIDQLCHVVDTIKSDPNSRRILMTTYNPRQVREGVLYPCHSLISQFYCQDEYIDMFCYNRSSDLILGVPFNIASSALLLCIVAQLTRKKPRWLYLTLGDVHIYSDHKKVAQEQLERIPYKFPLVTVPNINTLDDIGKISVGDFKIENYISHELLRAKMIV